MCKITGENEWLAWVSNSHKVMEILVMMLKESKLDFTLDKTKLGDLLENETDQLVYT